jgi:hypothetical protein
MDRQFAGVNQPPPATPPRHGSSTYGDSPLAVSPVSALSPSRRGIKGPRIALDSNLGGRDTTETEREANDAPGTAKKVTWSKTEEVLEFDVEEERRRRSGASTISESTMSERSDDDADRSGDSSIVFEEGGSLVMHDSVDVDGEAEDESSASIASKIDEMIEEFTDVFSPSLISDEPSMEGPSIASTPLTMPLPKVPSPASVVPLPVLPLAPRSRPSSSTVPASTFASASYPGSTEDKSVSFSYDDTASQFVSELPALATSRSFAPTKKASTPSLYKPSEYALPDLPENSPFVGFTSPVVLPLSPRAFRNELHHSTTAAVTGPPSPYRSPRSPNRPPSLLLPPIPLSPASIPLSRHASIVEAEDNDGTIRGAGPMNMGRDKLFERSRKYEDMLEGVSGALEKDAKSIGASSAQEVGIVDKESIEAPSLSIYRSVTKGPRAIPARPALNSSASTTSSTSSGSSTSIIASESALDRLQQGVRDQAAASTRTLVKENESVVKLTPRKGRARKSLSTGDIQVSYFRRLSNCCTTNANHHRTQDVKGPPTPSKIRASPLLNSSTLNAAEEAEDDFASGMHTSLKQIFKSQVRQITDTPVSDECSTY